LQILQQEERATIERQNFKKTDLKEEKKAEKQQEGE